MQEEAPAPTPEQPSGMMAPEDMDMV